MDKVLTRKLFKDTYLKTLGKQISNFNKGGLASLKINHFKIGGNATIEDSYYEDSSGLETIPVSNMSRDINEGPIVEKSSTSTKSSPSYVSKEDYTKDTLALGVGSGQATGTTVTREPNVITPPVTKSSPSIIPAPTNPVKTAIRQSPELGSVYSEGERKAMLLAPIASALLTGTRMPGQSQLGAVGSNIGMALPKVAETSLQIKKIENERLSELAKLQKATNENSYEYFHTLNDAELKTAGLPKGTFAQEKIKVLGDGRIVRTNDVSIKEKPTAEDIQKQADRDQALDQLKGITVTFNKLGKPTGPIVGNFKSYWKQTGLGDKEFAQFESDVELYNKNFIKATRGAQVGPQEVKELSPVLLSVTDNPDVMAAKIKVHDKYLGTLNERVNSYKGNLKENKYLPNEEFSKDLSNLKTNIYGSGSAEKLPSGVVKIRAKNLG